MLGRAIGRIYGPSFCWALLNAIDACSHAPAQVQHAQPRPCCNLSSVHPQARQLVRQLNEYNITLIDLENSLLFRLANSQGDILEDIELIENLEQTKVREALFVGVRG